MKLRKEKKVETRTLQHAQTGEKIERNFEVEELVFDLTCHCGKKGGEIRFPLDHGRDSDEALEAELNYKYSHLCDDHNTPA